MRNGAKSHVDPEAIEAVKSNLATIRKKRGLTQIELGEKIGASQRVITYYENEAKNISWDAITTLAKALEVPVKKLIDSKKDDGFEEAPLSKPLLKRISMLSKLTSKGQKMVQDYIDTVYKAERAG
jgi:transcriptional regulator with XRE-family HTH domain